MGSVFERGCRRGARLKWSLAAVTASASFTLDFAAKRWAQGALLPGERRGFLPLLDLQLVTNKGVAFGMLASRSFLIQVAAAAALCVIVAYVIMEQRSIPGGLAGGLLIGGSLGNLVERATTGQVTDFLKLPHWPNFNLADIFIVVGVVFVAVSLAREGGKSSTGVGAGGGEARS